MFREFEFLEVLTLSNSYGKKRIDCKEGRGFSVSYKHVEKEIYEISVTDCLPENLNVEILPRDDHDKLEELSPNNYLITRDQFSYIKFEVFVKSTKFYKQVDPLLPCRIAKESCIVLEKDLLKTLKLGETTACQFQPYDGVIIDAEICMLEYPRNPGCYYNSVKLTSSTHVLQMYQDIHRFRERVILSFFPGQTSPSAASNAEESTVTLSKQIDCRYHEKKPAITLNIFEKKKSFQEKIDAHGSTNVNIKTADKKVVKVHKETLIAKSPVLAALLDSEEELPFEIEVTYDAESVLRAMTFVYDKLEIEGFEPECYKFAEEFGMPELKEKCLKAMEEMKDWENIPYKYTSFAYEKKMSTLLHKKRYYSRFNRDMDETAFASRPTPAAPVL